MFKDEREERKLQREQEKKDKLEEEEWKEKSYCKVWGAYYT